MASTTTDKFRVEITFKNARAKFMHLVRNMQTSTSQGKAVVDDEEFECNHVESNNLNDLYTFKRGHLNEEEKWGDYYFDGQYTNSKVVKLVKSDALSDNFDVEVSYAGKQKEFNAIFTRSGRGWSEKAELLESNTVVSNKKYKAKKKSEDMKIVKKFVEGVAEMSGLEKAKRCPKIKETGKFKVSIVSSNHYFDYDENHSDSCAVVHLGNWKVGIIPDKQNLAKVKVVAFRRKNVANPDVFVDPLRFRTFNNFNSLDIVNGDLRDKHFDYMYNKRLSQERHNKDYREGKLTSQDKMISSWEITEYMTDSRMLCKRGYNTYFLGDPNFDAKLADFLKEVDSTHTDLPIFPEGSPNILP